MGPRLIKADRKCNTDSVVVAAAAAAVVAASRMSLNLCPPMFTQRIGAATLSLTICDNSNS